MHQKTITDETLRMCVDTVANTKRPYTLIALSGPELHTRYALADRNKT